MAMWLTVTDMQGSTRQINFDLILARRPTFPYEEGATVLTLCSGKYLHIQEAEKDLIEQSKQARSI